MNHLLGSSFFTTILTDSSSASRLFNQRGPEPQPLASSAGGMHCLDTRLQSQGLGFPQGSPSIPSSSISASFSGPLLCPQAGCVHEGRRAHQLRCLGSVCLTREGVTVCLKPRSPALEASCTSCQSPGPGEMPGSDWIRLIRDRTTKRQVEAKMLTVYHQRRVVLGVVCDAILAALVLQPSCCGGGRIFLYPSKCFWLV